MKGSIARLLTAVGAAGALGFLAGLVLRLGPGVEHFLRPGDLAVGSCLVWLVLAHLVKRREWVGTVLLGVTAVVLIAALSIVRRFGVALWSAEDKVTAAQSLEGLSLMMAMQLAPTIVISGWVTFPAEVLTAFLVRRIMRPRSV